MNFNMTEENFPLNNNIKSLKNQIKNNIQINKQLKLDEKYVNKNK